MQLQPNIFPTGTQFSAPTMIIPRIDRLHLLFALLSSTLYFLSFRQFLFIMLSVFALFLPHLHSRLFSHFHRHHTPAVVHLQGASKRSTRETVGAILIISSASSTALKMSLKLIDCLARATSYYIQRWSSGRKNETWCFMMMLFIGLVLIGNLESWFVCSKSKLILIRD